MKIRRLLIPIGFILFPLWSQAKEGGQRRVLQSEKVYQTRGSDKTTVDFDAVDISGTRRTPVGSLIMQNKTDKNYDFVKIRHNWHPEMLQSANNLSAPSP